ncbi:MAG: flagellar hook-basal body complex protein FliE [Nitrospirae bacterium]|nr:flagellar hook-basal body complex protein FliE [Nitrospirota bacterium]MBI3351830.1 flagellar hook-basal body complex protein FliE [Nitrospirota bacterium]
MNIQPVQHSLPAGEIEKFTDIKEPGGKPFLEMLKDSLSQVDQNQKSAEEAVKGLETGSHQNIHQTMIALEKADLSLQMMMQVRNKILSAYEEISRMQM